MYAGGVGDGEDIGADGVGCVWAGCCRPVRVAAKRSMMVRTMSPTIRARVRFGIDLLSIVKLPLGCQAIP